MRREVLFSSVLEIIEDIHECGIPEFFEMYIEQYRSSMKESKNGFSVPLGVFQKYMIATHNYNEDKIEICKIVGIDKLLDVKYWESLSIPNHPKEINEMRQNVQFAVLQLPKILTLTKQHYISEIKSQQSDLPEELKGKSLLTVLIVENKGQFSTPLRLTCALGAITDLYSVVATIENENENDLIVLACDSGSDKSFDFLGLAKLMEEVKEIIIAIWDRRVFHRQRHVSESIALIAESLPILEKIEQLRESGSIGKEQAELLKRKTISGATQFIEAGATIPEFESASSHNPKQLMKPEPKLLVSPWSNNPSNDDEIQDNSEQNEDTTDSDTLSKDEAQMLDLLLKKSKPKKKPKNSKSKHITKKSS